MSTTTLVSDLIRQRRTKRGLTQADLAEKVEVSRNTVNRWENADPRSKPTEASRKALAKHLGGAAADYEWGDDDYERAERLERVRHEAARYVRQLLSGELD